MAVAVIGAIFTLSSAVFNGLVLLLMLGGLFEWRRLCDASVRSFLLNAMGMVLFAGVYQFGYLNIQALLGLFLIGVLIWLWLALSLGRESIATSRLCLTLGGLLLSLAWLAIVALRDKFGQHDLMLVFLIVWSADSFAYFGGKRFGKTKLAPSISPAKTREGVACGMLMAVMVALIYSHTFIAPISTFLQIVLLLGITVFVALISVIGDLTESKLKRAAGIKDSGQLIPGHGGILDRIDGLIAAVVVYAFYRLLLSLGELV